MSAKSKESAKALDRPFSPSVLKEARKIADAYQVILNCEDKHWYGRGLEMPNVFGDGKTVIECVKDTREALCGAVALLLEQGQRPLAPSQAGTRTAQVNVRLSAEEKALLESTAKRKGYSGLSDFIRAAAIESAR
jgi:predicted RNase H-like HicB family nuclease